jgi:hypothetical protein
LPYWLGSWSWLTIPLPPLTPELAILAATAAARSKDEHATLSLRKNIIRQA